MRPETNSSRAQSLSRKIAVGIVAALLLVGLCTVVPWNRRNTTTTKFLSAHVDRYSHIQSIQDSYSMSDIRSSGTFGGIGEKKFEWNPLAPFLGIRRGSIGFKDVLSRVSFAAGSHSSYILSDTFGTATSSYENMFIEPNKCLSDVKVYYGGLYGNSIHWLQNSYCTWTGSNTKGHQETLIQYPGNYAVGLSADAFGGDACTSCGTTSSSVRCIVGVSGSYTITGTPLINSLMFLAACVDLAVMKHPSSSPWTIVVRQTMPFYFTTDIANQGEYNLADPSNDNYCNLKSLYNCAKDGVYELKLSWPGSTFSDQIWKQTSNPWTYRNGVTGYEAVNVHYTNFLWGGLEWNGNYAMLDGSVGANVYWYYAVGVMKPFRNAYPGPSYSTAVNKIELYVSCDV